LEGRGAVQAKYRLPLSTEKPQLGLINNKVAKERSQSGLAQEQPARIGESVSLTRLVFRPTIPLPTLSLRGFVVQFLPGLNDRS
jgi:hypothetical protein